MNTQQSKAEPCPFCKSFNISIEWEPCEPLDYKDTNRRWFAECGQCCCQGPFCQKENEVIPAWNRRATTVHEERLKKIQEDLSTTDTFIRNEAKKVLPSDFVDGDHNYSVPMLKQIVEELVKRLIDLYAKEDA